MSSCQCWAYTRRSRGPLRWQADYKVQSTTLRFRQDKSIDSNTRTFKESCHCQFVRFERDSEFPELATYDCSICGSRTALAARVNESAMEVLSGGKLLATYQLHLFTVKHCFCKLCGVHPLHRKRVAPEYFGVNVFRSGNLILLKKFSASNHRRWN